MLPWWAEENKSFEHCMKVPPLESQRGNVSSLADGCVVVLSGRVPAGRGWVIGRGPTEGCRL